MKTKPESNTKNLLVLFGVTIIIMAGFIIIELLK